LGRDCGEAEVGDVADLGGSWPNAFPQVVRELADRPVRGERRVEVRVGTPGTQTHKTS
jgi:hypothetical protein